MYRLTQIIPGSRTEVQLKKRQTRKHSHTLTVRQRTVLQELGQVYFHYTQSQIFLKQLSRCRKQQCKKPKPLFAVCRQYRVKRAIYICSFLICVSRFAILMHAKRRPAQLKSQCVLHNVRTRCIYHSLRYLYSLWLHSYILSVGKR